MGTGNIPARANSQVIDENWFNLLQQVLAGDYVPRNVSGVATANAGNLGSALFPWSKVFFGLLASGLTLDDDGSGNIVFKIGGVVKASIGPNGISRAHFGPLSPVISSSCGTNSITSASAGTYTDVPNLNNNFVSNGNPVVLELQPDGVNPSVIGTTVPSGAGTMTVAFVRDGTVIAEYTIRNSASVALGMSGLRFTDFSAGPGSHVYKVQYEIQFGPTGSFSNWVLATYNL